MKTRLPARKCPDTDPGKNVRPFRSRKASSYTCYNELPTVVVKSKLRFLRSSCAVFEGLLPPYRRKKQDKTKPRTGIPPTCVSPMPYPTCLTLQEHDQPRTPHQDTTPVDGGSRSTLVTLIQLYARDEHDTSNPPRDKHNERAGPRPHPAGPASTHPYTSLHRFAAPHARCGKKQNTGFPKHTKSTNPQKNKNPLLVPLHVFYSAMKLSLPLTRVPKIVPTRTPPPTNRRRCS